MNTQADEIEILIDVGTLPRGIGTVRQDRTIIFDIADRDDILDWVDCKFRNVNPDIEKVTATITGRMPSWLQSQIVYHLHDMTDRIMISAPNHPSIELVR